ncbi:response regulator [Paenibacillus turpanensis]|uniref:response regulator n=1 Tax=Paenibacillus turpanensis TaxID=2689078 RepID=UPI00140D4F4E|nr:response regulator transcription factor [Paenibacillus turpanensis]
MTPPIKLMLVDDQDLIRESLHIVLDMDPELQVIAMAENGKRAVELAAEELPDVILMDIHMPIMDGVEATRLLKNRYPGVRIIILTTFQEIGYVVDALSSGAEGYLLKAIHPKDLVAGIKWVSQGGTLIPQDIARLLVQQVQSAGQTSGAADQLSAGRAEPTNHPGTESHAGNGERISELSRAPAAGNVYGLSERELQVLHCVAEGLNNKEIAEQLFLSEGTVKNYISNIYSKMDVRDRIHATKKAHDEGLV